jgi:hypothetical protein
MPADTVIHLPTVQPGINPHGVWIRICTRHELLIERALESVKAAARAGEVDGGITKSALEQGQDCWLYIYDGDTGACVRTIIAKAKG